jgi:DNA-binding SARP family transcriptional activator
VADMKFGLLGTVVCFRDGAAVPMGAAKPRAVLAALLLDANRVVSADRLTDVLWGDRPPSSAGASLHNHVGRVRAFLGEDGRGRVEAVAPGYRIRVYDAELDLEMFTGLSERGYAARRAGDWESAARDLRAALALWRGDPLADVTSQLLQSTEVPRLSELRLAALETRLAADLHLGRHESVIPELGRLVADHPLRERLHGSLMLACYQAGRQAEALAAYQHARRLLVNELGVEPSDDLRELHERILAADPGLTAGQGSTSPARPAGAIVAQPPVPSQLPADIPDFTGREEQVRMLVDLFTTVPDPERPGVVVVSAITGAGGIGKTTLAVHVAHRLRARFVDGQLYVDLRGTTGPLNPADVLARFLRDLGIDPARIPADDQERAGLLRTLLSGRRMLILLDDARDAAQVRPLLPGSGSCSVVVTSRNRMTGLAGTHLDLDVLDDDSALALYARILGPRRVAAEPDAVATLVRLSSGLPLAIRIAAARLAARPGWSVTMLASRLADGRQRISELRIGDLAVRSSFELSYAALRPDAAGHDPARAFRLLGLFEGADLSLPGAAALLATGEDQARDVLDTLLDAHLLQPAAAGRYRLHDLLRVYAAERAFDGETPAAREDAVRGLIAWYLHTADAAAGVLEPRIQRVPLDAAGSPVRPLEFGSYTAAMEWCETERANLIAASHQAAQLGLHVLAWQLPFTLRRFFRLRKYQADWIATFEIALASARILGDRGAEASILSSLGEPYNDLGHHDKAIGLRLEAVAIYRDLGDLRGEAGALANVAVIFGLRGEPREALAYLERALPIFRDTGDAYNEARALGNIGEAMRACQRHDEAISHLRKALAIHSRLGGESYSQAIIMGTLGDVYLDVHEYENASECFRQALSIGISLSDRGGEAFALNGLGRALSMLGRDAEARQSWLRARDIFADIGDPRAADVDAQLRLPRTRALSPDR